MKSRHHRRIRWRRIIAYALLPVIAVLGSGASLPSLPEAHAAGSSLPACQQAVQYAITRQGALYSQGGAHPFDPINPATGRPYPRDGPWSFDCSGLVFAAYRAAGIIIGATTMPQSQQGVLVPCTLANLNGSATTCWAPGDLIFLRASDGNRSSRHVAMYVGNGLFMDCYNHARGCVLHEVQRSPFYQRTFWQARRIVSGCEGMTINPGRPVPAPLPGAPGGGADCIPEDPGYPETGLRYLRGCGPPVRPGVRLRHFDGSIGWLGPTGRAPPPGFPAQLELRVRFEDSWVNLCRWPYQIDGQAPDQPPPGVWDCWSMWLNPQEFLPLAHADSLVSGAAGAPQPVGSGQAGDPQFADAPFQLPPPGHPSTLILAPTGDPPSGAWWSPGNDDRARNARCPLGGPQVTSWMEWLINVLFSWLLGC